MRICDSSTHTLTQKKNAVFARTNINITVLLFFALPRTWNQPHGAVKVFWLTVCQPFTRAEIEFLPVYNPSEEEKADAKLYARNVREVRRDLLSQLKPQCPK